MADHKHCPLFADQGSFPDSTRFNKLGGAYQNGKPLAKWVRRQIIVLAQNGVRQCDISRRLLITHGCVSKILSKYQRTGRFEAGGRYRGGRRIITTPRMLSTDGCIQEQPEIFPWNIRRYPPCQENLFGADGHRSPSSIRRSLLQTGVIEQREPRTSQEQGDGRRSPVIANILNLSSNEQSTTTSNESQPCQQTESFPYRAVSRDLSEGACSSFPLPIRRIERIKYTSQQLRLLEAAFERGKYLTRSIAKQLAKDTGLLMGKIQIWFSNRRAKERKKASVRFCADSNTQPPQAGIGNRYPGFLVAHDQAPPPPPPPRNSGPSRIYFPSGAHVNKCSEIFQTPSP